MLDTAEEFDQEELMNYPGATYLSDRLLAEQSGGKWYPVMVGFGAFFPDADDFLEMTLSELNGFLSLPGAIGTALEAAAEAKDEQLAKLLARIAKHYATKVLATTPKTMEEEMLWLEIISHV